MRCCRVAVWEHAGFFGGKRNAEAGKGICCFGACLEASRGCWGGSGFSNPKGKCSSETGKRNFLLSINNGKSPLQWLPVEFLGMQRAEDAQRETPCPALGSLGTPGNSRG